ncbi:hypothetical protein [Dyadobacter sp. MSC1_007]|jgi:hypothetical protein|uniref:hypothetical protein n=1 Tax=Dyadobacter sp. MSC1_007 TaxID=2909264 RepID=UPI00202EB5E7|nr:hypothetical protein [Dyadobacter sp. MSC1_007]
MRNEIYKIVLMLMLLLDFHPTTAQNRVAFYDAKALTEIYKGSSVPKNIPITDATVIRILESYYGTGTDVADLVSRNKFLKPYFPAGTTASLTDSQKNLLTQPASSIGNFDVTNLVSGAARFLAERTREELNEAFFKKMKEQLNAFPELKTVFPQTTSFLNVIETYSYASVLQVLKEAFETDVQNLPENLYLVKTLTSASCPSGSAYVKCNARLQKLSDFFRSPTGLWVGLGLYSAKEAVSYTNPASFLNQIAKSSELTAISISGVVASADYNTASIIALSNFISQSLISTDENQVWITSNQFTTLIADKDMLNIYLGLLYASTESAAISFKINGAPDKTFQMILDEYHPRLPEIESLIKSSYSAFNATNNAVKQIKVALEKSESAKPQQALYQYYKTFTSSLKPVAHSSLLEKATGNIKFGEEYDKIENFLNPAVDIAYHISVKSYSSAIYDVTILLKNLDAFDGDFKPLTKSFVKYGTLISTVANAQSSDEVKKALEASVLPVGSSAIKRNSLFNMAVNAYVGGYWGKTINKDSPVKTFGLYAPIGVSFSLGIKRFGGFSITPQIIDLGALVNYYLVNGDNTALPDEFKVRASNIFAPGGQIAYNIPKTPLCLTYGVQFIPSLYSKGQIASNSIIQVSNDWRWHLSLVVDIPLFNIKVIDFKK